ITSHSVLGVTMMFFARSMRRIFCLPPVGKRKVYPRAEDSVTDRVAARSYHRRMRALALLVLLCACSGGGGGDGSSPPPPPSGSSGGAVSGLSPFKDCGGGGGQGVGKSEVVPSRAVCSRA